MTEIEKEILHRTRLLVGDEILTHLQQQRAIIFGIGGVGSWCAESLVRSGIRHLTIVDSDRVCISNVNRQLMATTSSVGQVKVEVLRQRLLDINPEAQITALQEIYNAENAESFGLEHYDIIVDAIDSLAEKAHLILRATQTKAIFVSSMGAALKMDPTKVKTANFAKVSGCPLARALRKKFKYHKTKPSRSFQVVYSDEVLPNLGAHNIAGYEPTIHLNEGEQAQGKQELINHSWNNRKAQINGTMSHITALFGFTMAGLILSELYRQQLPTCSVPKH